MPKARPAPKSIPNGTRSAPETGLFRRAWVAPLALILLTALVWAPSLKVPVHDWDDHVYFFRDTRVENLTADNVRRILTEPFFSNYHPVTTLTIAFDRAAWKTWVPGFHLTQLFFYVGGVLGVYFLFARILRRRAWAFAGAAIYAVHAVHVESVAWLASRKDVVCLFFYVFALLAYVRYTDSAKGRWRPYALSVALAAAAMLSKGYAVILPALLCVYDLCFSARVTRRNLLDKIPFLVLAAVTSIVTVHAQDKQSALVQVALSGGERIVRLGEVLALYVGHTLLPVGLSAIYATGTKPPNPLLALIGLILAGAIVVAFLAWRRSRPAAAFGLALFVLPLATVMNVYYTLRIWMTDRYLLFPTIGSSLLLIALAAPLLQRAQGAAKGPGRARFGKGLAWAATTIVLLYSVLTISRIGVWTTGVRLWSDVLRHQLHLSGAGPVTAAELSSVNLRQLVDPGPVGSLKRAYEAQGNTAEAGRLEAAVDTLGQQGYEHSEMKLARLDLGAGRYPEALRRLRPVAAGKTWLAPLAMFRIGVAEERLGHAEQSREAFRQALAMYREWNQPPTDAYFEVGTMEYLAANYPKAIEWYRLGLKESPRDANTAFHLGLALEQSGEVAEAVGIYQRIVSGELFIKPHTRFTLADVYVQLGNACETIGRKQDAARYFAEALRLAPNHPKASMIQARIAALTR